MKNRHIIAGTEPGSIAEEMEIAPGDELLEINRQKIEDIFDYRYLTADSSLLVLIRKPDGEEWELEIEKDPDEDLGIVFENEFLDVYRSCRNRCVFCFIDQMPKGMRDTLYFKDDDMRLSFLQGNYVTLTNMREHDIDRIIHYRMEPINISFHTTNPELRCQMLHNRHAGEWKGMVDRLYEAGIGMNGQIVLCRGLNDGAELDRTIGELLKYAPVLQSVSVVPVGLTKFRDGLYPLESFDAASAEQVLKQIHGWQDEAMRRYGIRFVYASDEWYLLAEEKLPSEEAYGGFPQLENGVGMLRLLEREVTEDLERRDGDGRKRKISLATGLLAAPFLKKRIEQICRKFPRVQAEVYAIRNRFFGEKITVSGLITYRDLKEQLSGHDLGDRLLLPCSMLRAGEEVFLDDGTVTELEQALGVPVEVVDADGASFCRAVLGETTEGRHKRRQIYEQTDSSNCGTAECREIDSF